MSKHLVRASQSRNYTCEQLRYIKTCTYMKADNESDEAKSRLSVGLQAMPWVALGK